MKNIGHYAKGIVGTAMAIVTALQPYYGGDKWFIAISAGLGALLVSLVPNSPKQEAAQWQSQQSTTVPARISGSSLLPPE